MRSTAHTAVHRFDVRAVYKGEVRQGQEVVSTADGSSCGLHAPPGVDVLVFADRTSHLGPQPGAGQLAGDLCNGTRPLELRPVPASFGAPTQPPQPSLETPAGVDEEDGSTSRRVLIGATGTAIAALAVVLARRREARRGPR